MSTNKDDYNHLGLTDSEVLQSREKNGINLLTPPKRPSLWKLYLEKFEDPVVRVLLVAAVFSLIISIIENEYAETIGIIAAILLATGIGFFFEYDANKKFDLLNAVNEETLVKVIRNGHVQEIPRKDVVVDDIIILETGEEIPADGQLLEAISLQVNESNLTGEPVINKTVIEADFDEEATYASNLVMRGTTVVDGHGTMRVLHVGDATEIGKVARQSTEENLEPTPLNIQLTKLANLIGKIGFTVAGLAFLIFFVKDVLLYFDFSSLNGWHEWLPVFERTLKYFMMAVTLIVVAVPEGLPMSVTLSLALNMRRMLSTNNLVRKMHACETMGAITVICTDKTGTLTEGKPVVTDIVWANGDDRAKAVFFSLEKLSEHPLADAVVHYFAGVPTLNVERFGSLTGKGIEGTVDGVRYFAGSRRLLDEQGIVVGKELNIEAQRLSAEAKSIVWFADSEQALAVAAIADRIKDSSVEAVRELQAAGIDVYMLTGDSRAVAGHIAEKAGIRHFEAEILPQDKAAFVKRLQTLGHKVAMAGDGINDSAALAQADLSIAMGGGSDIAMDVAQMTIISSDLRKIPEAIQLSKQTVRTIRQNLFWAFIYNLVGIPVAAGALYPVSGFLLNPMIAGAAMALSSVSVVANSLRLKYRR